MLEPAQEIWLIRKNLLLLLSVIWSDGSAGIEFHYLLIISLTG